MASPVAHRRIPFQSTNYNVFVAHRSNAMFIHISISNILAQRYIVHSSKHPSRSRPCNKVECHPDGCTHDTDPEDKAKAEDLTLKVKTKDLITKAKDLNLKAKNMPYCPRGLQRCVVVPT